VRRNRFLFSVTCPDWSIVVVLLTGTFMAVLDFFIVNVAIPDLRHDLSASPAQIQFVVAGYGLASATPSEVAIIGMIFYGILSGGAYRTAFGASLAYLIAVCLLLCCLLLCFLAQLLPPQGGRGESSRA